MIVNLYCASRLAN